MHIKTIAIRGFKTYRQQVFEEEFSEKVNIIVGPNGSGKSNLFSAIRFVLGDGSYGTLRESDRRDLLHETSDNSIVTAEVEIVFSNEDRRFPLDEDEVIIRRTIGLKKDQYFVNRKPKQKGDIESLLESAGFSPSNTYFIVPQGKVKNLCEMDDKKRLQLLKEVAGTRMYEDKRLESVRLLEESNMQRDHIADMVEKMETKLQELSEEKEELQSCQALDRTKRALEYVLYEKDYNDAKDKVEQYSVSYDEELQATQGLEANMNSIRQTIVDLDGDMRNLKQQIAALTAEKTEIDATRNKVIKESASLHAHHAALREKAQSEQESQERLKAEYERVEKAIAEAEAKLNEVVLPEYNKQCQLLQDVEQRIQTLERRRETIYAKNTRASKFTSAEERDEFLRKQITVTKESLEVEQSSASKLLEDISNLKNDLETEETVANKLEEAEKKKETTLTSLRSEITQLEDEQTELQRTVHGIREVKEKHEKEKEEYTTTLERAESKLMENIPYNMRVGLGEIEKLALNEENPVEGIYGPLYDLFTPKAPRFNTAIEVAAQRQLFNVVVEDDEVAAKLITHLQSHRKGRVTFTPLSRLSKQKISYPSDVEEVMPLIKQLNYHERFHPVMQSVFGRVLLCKNQEAASRYAAGGEFTCITLEGEQIDKRGAMFGGYYDPSISVMRQAAVIDKARDRIGEAEEAIDKATKTETSTLSELSRVKSKLTHLYNVRQENENGLRRAREEKTQSFAKIQNAKRLLSEKSEQSRKTESSVSSFQAQLKAFEDEIGTDLHAGFSSAERTELVDIADQLQSLHAEEQGIQKQLDNATTEKLKVEELLEMNLRRRLMELRKQLNVRFGGTAEESKEDIIELLTQCERDLKLAEEDKERSRARRAEVMQQLKEANLALENTQDALDKAQKEEKEVREQLDQHARSMQKFVRKKQTLTDNRNKAADKIRDLGTVSLDELDEYKPLDRKTIIYKLKSVNEELKQYSHVNRKAVDMFNKNSEELENLLQKKEEVDKGNASIRSVIQHLDMKKDEAIQRTFKGVAMHFRDVFKELVPEGHGQLEMRLDDDGEEKAEEDGYVEAFKGVAIKVCFTAGGETYQMQQLSGGQKTIVALALIFAIQRSDPAPFYLFDEIDANLDATYRSRVADLVRRQANSSMNPAQFIITTFRPELLSVADTTYGVKLKERSTSEVLHMSMAEAKEFIMREETSNAM